MIFTKERRTIRQKRGFLNCSNERNFPDIKHPVRGGSRLSGKGVHMFKGVGVCFADFIYLIYLKYPMKMK